MTETDDDEEYGNVIAAADIKWETKDVPYDDFDPEIVGLCKLINEFPGIVTSSSCQGFLNNHRPEEPWHVYFECDGLPTLEAYASIEFLVYLRREALASGFDICIGVYAPPPILNGLCRSMYFTIECKNRHPDDYAAFIRDMRKEIFFIPDTSGEHMFEVGKKYKIRMIIGGEETTMWRTVEKYEHHS
jgi:hypothetical protein